jgi:hypothetical protein
LPKESDRAIQIRRIDPHSQREASKAEKSIDLIENRLVTTKKSQASANGLDILLQAIRFLSCEIDIPAAVIYRR